MKPFSLIITLTILVGLIFHACKQEDGDLFPEESPKASNDGRLDWHAEFNLVDQPLEINTTANANYLGIGKNEYIKDISAGKSAYCHPDVVYFADGFKGYKYWMVFTPYFGTVGTDLFAKRYENPTVVASHDAIHWEEPEGIKNPIQRTMRYTESLREVKHESPQGFWSDVDWLFSNGQFELYYRGSCVQPTALLKRGAKSENNRRKLGKAAMRTIVRQTSSDGIHWTPLEAVINSNPPSTPRNNHLISPTFIKVDNQYISYEVELNSGKKNFRSNDPSFIIRRTSENGLDFSPFSSSKIVRFLNKPWGDYSPWHIQATYVDGYYFLLIAVGNVGKYTSEQLYAAYSTDGFNFYVHPQPFIEKDAYRSALFPISSDGSKIVFGCILGYKSGIFKYGEWRLKKDSLDSTISNLTSSK